MGSVTTDDEFDDSKRPRCSLDDTEARPRTGWDDVAASRTAVSRHRTGLAMLRCVTALSFPDPRTWPAAPIAADRHLVSDLCESGAACAESR